MSTTSHRPSLSTSDRAKTPDRADASGAESQKCKAERSRQAWGRGRESRAHPLRKSACQRTPRGSAPHSERRRHCWSEDGSPRRESASDATDHHRHQVRAFNFTRVSSAAVCGTDAARTGICHAGRAPAAMEMIGIRTVDESPSLPPSGHGFNELFIKHLRTFPLLKGAVSTTEFATVADCARSESKHSASV
jgi:hypothetical protein